MVIKRFSCFVWKIHFFCATGGWLFEKSGEGQQSVPPAETASSRGKRDRAIHRIQCQTVNHPPWILYQQTLKIWWHFPTTLNYRRKNMRRKHFFQMLVKPSDVGRSGLPWRRPVSLDQCLIELGREREREAPFTEPTSLYYEECDFNKVIDEKWLE